VGNEDKSSSLSEIDKKNEEIEEEEFQGYRVPIKGFKKSVNILLKEITDLKDAKSNSMNMVNNQVMMKYIAEINAKIEQRLKDLLNLIMDKDIEENMKENENTKENTKENKENLKENIKENGKNLKENHKFDDFGENLTMNISNFNENSIIRNSENKEEEEPDIVEDEKEVKRIKDRERMKEDLKKNLKLVVKDIDKLQGKFIDGHLKTKLLFQFLKEYRKLQEEKQQVKMNELDETAINKEDVENPFDKNLNNVMEKENHGEKLKRYKTPNMKNLKVMNKGWDVNKNQVIFYFLFFLKF